MRGRVTLSSAMGSMGSGMRAGLMAGRVGRGIWFGRLGLGGMLGGRLRFAIERVGESGGMSEVVVEC